MHILATSSAGLDETAEPVDLQQTPGTLVALSFTDSDLAGLATAWETHRDHLPSLRLASLRELRHPMSVDLWVDSVARHARVIVVRLLGGMEWWRYGVEQLARSARRSGCALVLLPGEDRDDDPDLARLSTVDDAERKALLAGFRAGGADNLATVLHRMAHLAGEQAEAPTPPVPLPLVGGYLPGRGLVDLDTLAAALPQGQPVIAIALYRSLLLAADTAPIEALCEALAQRGLAAAPLVVPGLRDGAGADFVQQALARLSPAVFVTTTGFSLGETLDTGPTPLVQAIIATTKQAGWAQSPRGLAAADLAMHVVLPELDGRVLGGVLSFKAPRPVAADLSFAALANTPVADRVERVAERLARLVHLQTTPRAQRRLAALLPDYPGAPGHEGYAVGLDVPASIRALIDDLRQAGYGVGETPPSSRALIDALKATPFAFPVADYRRLAPPAALARLTAVWGAPEEDADVTNGAFRFRVLACGRLALALPPERGRRTDRRAAYHDPALVPRHALLAFGLWLRHVWRADALIHMGAHGTLEWLPGKAVALSADCWPEAVVGPLPVVYPFLVSNPGEAAQAKRRLSAVTLGHLPPPLVEGEMGEALRTLDRLVDEYAQAEGLDRRRRDRLARLIVDHARDHGLDREAGVDFGSTPEEALIRIDAWLCDVKEMMIRDGLHIYGRGPCGDAERDGLLAALDGQHVPPGPAGAPARGRHDVVPTGRNLFGSDPRTLPTPTAMDLGRLAADEIIRLHLQEEGEMPRSLVIDLWGSASLRTGGEEIAQGLALMGCRPTWDDSTGRVTGVEVLPPAVMGRPRVDVTWRISGLFRDLFPSQIALLDLATHAVAERDERPEENPLATLWQTTEPGDAARARIFGSAPGAYGAGVEDMLRAVEDLDTLGRAYLAFTSHAYEGAEGRPVERPGAFAERVKSADLLLHSGDDPGRDLLDGGADVAHIGGFAAAARVLGTAPRLTMLDTTRPDTPRARPLDQALARIVRGRAANPRFIAGQMRHGPRGAAELAEAVDRLVSFAETTGAVPSPLFDLLHDAYVTDEAVRDFLRRENPAAAHLIATRLETARTRALWHPRRNDVDTTLAALKQDITQDP